jgi:hypothetical protein
MYFRAMGWLVFAAAIYLPAGLQGECRASPMPLEVSLEYTAAPECPVADDFMAIVGDRLGYNAFRKNATTHVQAEILPRGRAFEGHIEWRNAQGLWTGDRSFPSRSDDCRQLVRAMAFALALQIQFLATETTSVEASKASATPVGEPAKTVPPPPRTDQLSNESPVAPALTADVFSPSKKTRWILSIGAGASVAFGLSSTADPLARAVVDLAFTHVSLDLGAAVGWPTTTRRPDGAGFSQRLLLIGAAGCGTAGRARVCLLANSGVARVTGKDIDVPTSSSGPIFQTGLRLAWMQPLGRHVYVAPLAEGLLNVMRWTVDLDQLPVWTAPRLAAIVGIDAGMQFP